MSIKSITTFCLSFIFFSLIYPSVIFASSVKINEFVAHPSSGNKEWIEFYNPDKTDLSSYWLDDDIDFTNDSGNSAKKSLKDIQGIDTLYPFYQTSSMFNNDGDYVVLFDADGNIIDQYQYTKDPGVDISIGRSPDGNGDFAVLSNTTQGSANSQPILSPTSSPTSTPVPTRTPTAKPTPKPTLTSKPKPTIKPTIQSESLSIVAKNVTDIQISSPITSNIPLLSAFIQPTATGSVVLGDHISVATAPTKQAIIAGENKPIKKNTISALFIPLIFGITLLGGCGILIFLKRKTRIDRST